MKWHHAGIEVRSLKESVDFYERIFGFEVEEYLTLPGERIVFLKNGEVRIELIESEEYSGPSEAVHLAWQVENIKVQGLQPTEGPYKLQNGWTTVFYEGLTQEIIELIQVKGE